MALEWIEDAVAAGARYEAACKVLGVDIRTVQRWKRSQRERNELSDRRKEIAALRTPANKLSAEECSKILAICHQPEYRSLPPTQIVPRLADKGEYVASESSFYRVLRAADEVHHRGHACAPKGVIKPESYCATRPNQVWSWDITFLASSIRGVFYRLYMVLDIYSRKIVGWEVHESELSEHASVLIRKACLSEGIHEQGLVLHSDNGGPMKGATMLATLQKLGVVPSFSRPSVSDDNPYSESLFRTLKYAPAYPRQPFESLEASRKWVHEFVHWYNKEHRHSAIRYVTPHQRHSGKDAELLKNRTVVYDDAKQRNPARWSGKTRNWAPIENVWLNPPKEHQADKNSKLKSA